MTVRPRDDGDHGFVMVPVIALIFIALAMGIALLTIVDTQTGQGRTQRMADAAQTLAEGVATATANTLASGGSASDWPTTGACQSFTGTLTAAPTGAPTTLAYRVATEIQARFANTSPDYASGRRDTTWTVSVCPVLGTGNGTSWTQNGESRWDDTFLTRSITAQPAGAPPPQLSLWVRAQAAVATIGSTQDVNTRAVATKVRQVTVGFTPPAGFAVGTGSFSTDVSTGLNSVTSSAVLSTVLGTQPLIRNTDSSIGVRCGLLNTLNNPSSVCLSGTFAGVSGVTNATGLQTLTNALGVGRAMSLATWTMAPDDAVKAWKDEAQTSGVYVPTPDGNGSVLTKNATVTSPECFTAPTTAQTVVYLGKVGNGEQYCTVSGTKVAKILIVERGGVRVSGSFTGVVYALNKQECTQADGSCSSADRTTAAAREVVRIEGNSGKVTGSVWADGAGGSIGIYPQLASSAVAAPQVLTNICSLPVLGPLLSTLNTTVTGVTNLLGQTLALLGNVQEQVRTAAGGTANDGCAALTGYLSTLTSTQQLTLFSTGGDVSVPVSEHRTRNCTSALLSLGCGAWSAWTTKDSSTVTLPALTAEVVSALTSTLASYTAIQYDAATVANAGARLSAGAGPVVGSYRNVAPN